MPTLFALGSAALPFSLALAFVLAFPLSPTSARAQTCTLPGAATVSDAAIRAAGIDETSTSTFRRRLRNAALLPNTARVELRAVEDDVLRLESRLDQDFDALDMMDGSDLTDVHRSWLDQRREIRVIIAWRLSDLAWSNDHLAVERLQRDLRRERAALVEDTIDTYFDWQRACALDAPPPGHHWVIAELEARLDALTDGWFRAMLDENPACSNLCTRAP